MSWTLGLAAGTVLGAAVIQSATGFGFALVAGPALFALVEPVEAVGLISVFGLVSNALVLFSERRALEVERRGALTALGFAVAGLPLGALAVTLLSRTVMTVVVAVVVLLLVGGRILRPRLVRSRPPRPPGHGTAGTLRGAAIAGFSAGVLTTSTTTSGPPLAIWLTGRGLRPAAIRDTACSFYLVVGAIGIGVLAVISGSEVFGAAGWLPVLLPLVVVGQVAGRYAFGLLTPRRYEQLVLCAAVAAAAVGLVRGFR